MSAISQPVCNVEEALAKERDEGRGQRDSSRAESRFVFLDLSQHANSTMMSNRLPLLISLRLLLM